MQRFIGLLLFMLFSFANAKGVPTQDIEVHRGKSVKFGNISATIVRFGGYTTPECKLAISNDGQYFYLRKVQSTCTTLTNSKGVKIICNSNKSVCKTRDELKEFITAKDNIKINQVKPQDKKGLYIVDFELDGESKTYRMYCPTNTVREITNGSWKKAKKASGNIAYVLDKVCSGRVDNANDSQDDSMPSWCNSSRLNKTEHAICADDNLSALDMKLAKVYGSSKASSKDKAQKEWLVKRDACGSDRSCIQKAYQSRIKELEQEIELAKLAEENQRLEEERERETYKILETLCDNGDAKACNAIGIAYDEGKHNYPIDDYKAITFYRKSCDFGSAVGCSNLGLMYANGEGTSKDLHTALRFLDKGCNKGNSNACSNASEVRNTLKNAFRGIRKNDCYKIKEYGVQQVCLNGTGGNSCYGLKNYGLQKVCLDGTGGSACYALKDYGEQRVCRDGIRSSACYAIKGYNRQRSCQNFHGSTAFWLIFSHYGYYTY